MASASIDTSGASIVSASCADGKLRASERAYIGS